jgi:phage terminase small subunit
MENIEKKLTGKQAAFIAHYTGDSHYNATDAVIKAGYKGCNNTLRAIAAENLTKPNIKLAIKQKSQEVSRKVDVTVEFIVEQLLIGLKMATERHNVVAMARFLELLGRYKAMFSDNINTVDVVRQRELDEAESTEAAELARLRLSEKYRLGSKEAVKPAETQTTAIVKVG